MIKNSSKKARLLMAAASSGLIASGQGAVIYNETSGDLSNNAGSPTILNSGTDTVIGTLRDNLDENDFFVIGGLVPGGTAIFDFTYDKVDDQQEVRFAFGDPSEGPNLFSTGFLRVPVSGSGSTPALTVPDSGEIRISVQIGQTAESGPPDLNWTVSTNDVVPEPGSSALVALSALTMMRRRRRHQ